MHPLLPTPTTHRPEPARARARALVASMALKLIGSLTLCFGLSLSPTAQAQGVGTVAPLNGNYTQQVSDLLIRPNEV